MQLHYGPKKVNYLNHLCRDLSIPIKRLLRTHPFNFAYAILAQGYGWFVEKIRTIQQILGQRERRERHTERRQWFLREGQIDKVEQTARPIITSDDHDGATDMGVKSSLSTLFYNGNSGLMQVLGMFSFKTQSRPRGWVNVSVTWSSEFLTKPPL